MDKTTILNLVKRRYAPPEWLVIEEVSSRTGYASPSADNCPLTAMRRIDAIAFGLWPSRGYKRVAFEIKLTRADWLREWEQPFKMIPAFYLSHLFYFILGPNIYKSHGEEQDMRDMPWGYDCGLMEVVDTKAGPLLYERWKPQERIAWPMPDSFVASLLRRVEQDATETEAKFWREKWADIGKEKELQRLQQQREWVEANKQKGGSDVVGHEVDGEFVSQGGFTL